MLLDLDLFPHGIHFRFVSAPFTFCAFGFVERLYTVTGDFSSKFYFLYFSSKSDCFTNCSSINTSEFSSSWAPLCFVCFRQMLLLNPSASYTAKAVISFFLILHFVSSLLFIYLVFSCGLTGRSFIHKKKPQKLQLPAAGKTRLF